MNGYDHLTDAAGFVFLLVRKENNCENLCLIELNGLDFDIAWFHLTIVWIEKKNIVLFLMIERKK